VHNRLQVGACRPLPDQLTLDWTEGIIRILATVGCRIVVLEHIFTCRDLSRQNPRHSRSFVVVTSYPSPPRGVPGVDVLPVGEEVGTTHAGGAGTGGTHGADVTSGELRSDTDVHGSI
jgi:hypothetical protein